MEALNNVLALHLLHAAVMEQAQVDALPLPPAPYQPRARRNRDDPFTLSDKEFKQNFRFNKDSVRRLADLLQLRDRRSRRGRPLSAHQQLCLALHHFGSKNFIRSTANCGKVSYSAAWYAINRVRNALVQIAPRFIRLPTDVEATATAERMLQKHGLPGFAYAIDGMIVFFDQKVKGIPRGAGLPNQQNFFTRKGRYGINTMIIANDQKLIHALDAEWHGAVHDARVWRLSLVRPLIEARPQFLLAGDSGYPISEVLMKPFDPREVRNDRRKTRFNRHLSGLRTRMSENVFADLKNRWQCLKDLRCHYMHAKKTILACAVLHNLSILWSDDFDFADAHPEHQQPPPVDAPPAEVHAVPAEVRRRGQERRDQLLAQMRR